MSPKEKILRAQVISLKERNREMYRALVDMTDSARKADEYRPSSLSVSILARRKRLDADVSRLTKVDLDEIVPNGTQITDYVEGVSF